MPALRLTFLVALVVGVLAVVAASTSMTRNPGEDPLGRTTTAQTAPAASAGEAVTATAPATEPIRARVGDLVQLTVTLKAADTVVVDAFGVHEDVGPGVPMLVPVVALRPGTFAVRTRLGGKRIATLVVSPARGAGGSGGTAPDDGAGERAPEAPGQDAPVTAHRVVVAL
ncbi:hypothetical protein [Patulibacter sp. SYSU D01012]|uniref:hypothetical protein n=1 Tax=Patulibacter sp. SYSU D01012 TaxID=2817381 RepID=UPI001B30FDB2|nr:hypothetical protein [Patulibacter sp. SYSU D01012]